MGTTFETEFYVSGENIPRNIKQLRNKAILISN